jgi:phosphonate transport system substrate-binding protein
VLNPKGWPALALATSLLTGCWAPNEPPAVVLGQLEPLPAFGAASEIPLRVAVSAVISPKGTVESYQPLLDYLSARLDRPVELIQRRTYAEVNDLVRDGGVDLAFVCTAAYITGRAEFGMELLAAPVVNGEAAYHSILIVPADSPATSLNDLRGLVFAFTDPLSHTGHNYPTWLLARQGATPARFFGRTFFTYSHDDAIRAVADGLADGAAVDSLVLDYALTRDPALGQRLRIIHTSPPFGIPPAVTGPEIRPQLRAELQALLLGLDRDPDGVPALHAIGAERFVTIDDSAYDSVRAVSAALVELSP